LAVPNLHLDASGALFVEELGLLHREEPISRLACTYSGLMW
jgi:hypothetical protein